MTKEIKNNKPGKKPVSAHTLNNLLTNISLSAQVLLQEVSGPLNKEQKTYVKSILEECKKMIAEIQRM